MVHPLCPNSPATPSQGPVDPELAGLIQALGLCEPDHAPIDPERARAMAAVPGNFILPALWRQQVGDASEAPEEPIEVIPLEELHRHLADPSTQGWEPSEALQRKLAFNLRFYGSWFPEETRAQFEQAAATLESRGIIPGWLYMTLERRYAPNAERFVTWVTTRTRDWNREVSEGGGSIYLGNQKRTELALIAGVATLWRDRLSPAQARQVRQVFRQTYAITERDDFSWGSVGWLTSGLLATSVAILADRQTPDLDSLLTRSYFSGDPAAVLERLDKDGVCTKKLSARHAQRVWNFFVRNYDALCLDSNYWNEMSSFLDHNPQFASDFFARRSTWLSMLPTEMDSSDTDKAHDFYVYNITEKLLVRGTLPQSQRRDAYLFLLREAGIDTRPYESLTTAALEECLIAEHLTRVAREEHSHSHLDTVSQHLFTEYANRWGATRMITFLQARLPAEVSSKMGLSNRLLRLFVDKSDGEARQFLAELQDSSRRDFRVFETDPLWLHFWRIFDGPMLSGIFEHASVETRYGRALKALPGMMLDNGQTDVVQEFYRQHHPYAAIYSLPPDLRPSGNEISFVSIDSFYDPRQHPYLDRQSVRIVDLNTPHWEKPEFSHGALTTALAVGDRYGLAGGQDVNLYIAPVDTSGENNFPLEMAESLEAVITLREQDSSVTVVGISLGLEVPQQFRPYIGRSAIFQRLRRAAQRLHEQGVIIIASAGNDGKPNHINMLGFVPHVTLAGSLDSQLTRERDDDLKSKYTTGADQSNPIRFFAHADPVLAPISHEDVIWLWQGGTSSAQPHLSGTILFLRQINPTLSGEDCLIILEMTADQTADRNGAHSIDPMEAAVVAAHLPGSTYNGERLAAFTRHLGHSTGWFRQLKIFQRIQSALQAPRSEQPTQRPVWPIRRPEEPTQRTGWPIREP